MTTWQALKIMFLILFWWVVAILLGGMVFQSLAVGFFGYPFLFAFLFFAMRREQKQKRIALEQRVQADIDSRVKQLMHEMPEDMPDDPFLPDGIHDLDS